MNPSVEQFIEQKNREYDTLKARQRGAVLHRAGLFSKIYEDEERGQQAESPSVSGTPEYPYVENTNGVMRRFRVEYPQLTAEEYDAVEAAQKRVDTLRPYSGTGETPAASGERSRADRRIVIAFLVLGIVMIAASLVIGILLISRKTAGFLFISQIKKEYFSVAAAAVWSCGLIFGSLMIAVSRIIDHMSRQTSLLRELVNRK